ncbi:MAG: DUF6538 domain-containing protein [Paracoccaceae bacterium]
MTAHPRVPKSLSNMPRRGVRGLHLRGSIWHLRRRVPSRYRSVETRTDIWQSLNTDSRREAERRAGPAWDRLVSIWDARLNGEDEDTVARLSHAKVRAAAEGWRYAPVEEIAQMPLGEILARVIAVGQASNGIPTTCVTDIGTPAGIIGPRAGQTTKVSSAPVDPSMAAALLGGAGADRMCLSQALDVYWSLAGDRILDKGPTQLRVWKAPRTKVFREVIELIGDKPLVEITKSDLLAIKQSWVDRIQTGKVGSDTAKKNLGYLVSVLREVIEVEQMSVDLPFEILKLRVKAKRKKRRAPFPTAWIRDRILVPGALDGGRGGLNDDARGILLTMINTGARPSEIAGLRSQDIVLDHAVPHIMIRPYLGHTLKNAASERNVPLVGVSLEAMRDHPGGFPRYRGHSATLSATVNAALRACDLMPTPEHTMYGLRHAFEDRLLAAGIDVRIRCDLMGHGLNRERYGEGAAFEHACACLEEIAL